MEMKNRKVFLLFMLGFLLLGMLFPLRAFADMGPKPAVTVVVENPPQGEYYLDLLTQSPASYDNLGDSRHQLNAAMLERLRVYEKDGWYPALSGGTEIPLFEKLTGIQRDDGAMEHQFSYFGVPSSFRVILVTRDGAVRVSEPVSRQSLQTTITYDYETETWRVPPVILLYLRQFFSTFLPTLLLEGLLLLLFRFSSRRNWLVFVAANLLTQIFVTLTLGRFTVQGGPLSYYFNLFWVELIVFAAETALYAFFLQGHSVKRRIFYALTANLCSMTAGIFVNVLSGASFYRL